MRIGIEEAPDWLRDALLKRAPPKGWAWELEQDGERWFVVMRINLYAATEVSTGDTSLVIDEKLNHLCEHDKIYINQAAKKYLA